MRVASTEMEEINEAHELSKRQSETRGPQEGKSLGIPIREVQLDGTIRRKHIVIGTQEDLPSVFRPGCCRCNPLGNQPTNPSKAHQEHQFRDACESLSPTRVAGHFQQNETGARCGRRRSQIVLDAGDLRGLSEEVDPSALACVQADGRQGNRLPMVTILTPSGPQLWVRANSSASQ